MCLTTRRIWAVKTEWERDILIFMKFSKNFSGRQHAINKFFMNILSLRALRQHNKLWVFIAAAVVYILLVVALEQHFPVNFTFNIIIINSGIRELWGSMKSQGRSSVDTMFTKCYFSTPDWINKVANFIFKHWKFYVAVLKTKAPNSAEICTTGIVILSSYYHASAAGKKSSNRPQFCSAIK